VTHKTAGTVGILIWSFIRNLYSAHTRRSCPLCPGCCHVKRGFLLARSRDRPVASRSQHAFVCSVWPSAQRSRNPMNARAASRAALDFRIPKPTPHRILWSWSSCRSFAYSARGAFDVLDRWLRAVLQAPSFAPPSLSARLLVTCGCRVIALAGIWITSVKRVAQTGREWAIIPFRALDPRENRYLLLDYNEPLRQSANIECLLAVPQLIVSLKH
jgi:hypothetical protein